MLSENVTNSDLTVRKPGPLTKKPALESNTGVCVSGFGWVGGQQKKGWSSLLILCILLRVSPNSMPSEFNDTPGRIAATILCPSFSSFPLYSGLLFF